MKNASRISRELSEQISKVTNKRARFVLDTITRNGVVTTEEINKAGYEHPPRAVRDARELGFPIQTIKTKNASGRTIAAYVFPENAHFGREKSGRRLLPKKQRNELITAAGSHCQICGADVNLQVDHRIPYEIAGEPSVYSFSLYMVLCGSCNRTKSWSCEHCSNWSKERNSDLCKTCYWSGNSQYSHVATQQQRRVDIAWLSEEINDYELLRKQAEVTQQTVSEYVKSALKKIS